MRTFAPMSRITRPAGWSGPRLGPGGIDDRRPGRELGMEERQCLDLARVAVEERAEWRSQLLPLLDALDALPSPMERPGLLTALNTRRAQARVQASLTERLSALTPQATTDPVTTYVWIALACTFGNAEQRAAAVAIGTLPGLLDSALRLLL
jgi:hypothetical protein